VAEHKLQLAADKLKKLRGEQAAKEARLKALSAARAMTLKHRRKA
jgi:hypothetical protein